jgi:hypothetical protein
MPRNAVSIDGYKIEATIESVEVRARLEEVSSCSGDSQLLTRTQRMQRCVDRSSTFDLNEHEVLAATANEVHLADVRAETPGKDLITLES